MWRKGPHWCRSLNHLFEMIAPFHMPTSAANCLDDDVSKCDCMRPWQFLGSAHSRSGVQFEVH